MAISMAAIAFNSPEAGDLLVTARKRWEGGEWVRHFTDEEIDRASVP